MKVRVTAKMAFYGGNRYRQGAEIEVPENFKAGWCAPVDQVPAPKKGKAPTPVALSQLGKAPSKTFNQVMGGDETSGSTATETPPADGNTGNDLA